MVYRGRVLNGVVVLEESVSLPEGSVVNVEIAPISDDQKSLREGLLKLAGTVDGLPEDMAENHDHYVHGQPR